MAKTKRRRTNASYAPSVSTSEPDAVSWWVFDCLPRLVRQALWASPVPINPHSARALVDNGGTAYAVEELENACRSEVRIFAAEHEARHGYQLPSVGVSSQPYEPAKIARRRRR